MKESADIGATTYVGALKNILDISDLQQFDLGGRQIDTFSSGGSLLTEISLWAHMKKPAGSGGFQARMFFL